MALLAQAHASQIGFFDAAPAVRLKSHFATVQGICWHNWISSGKLGQGRRLTAKQCRKLPAVCARSRRNVSRRRHARCEATPQRDSAELEIEVQEKAEKVAEGLGGVNVYLVGMMGSGKSTIGRLLAERLNYRFFDSDEVVERAVGAPISQIFQENGEDAFRKLETEVLSQLASLTRTVISTGGGAVLRKENWSHMHYGISVFLQVPIHTLAKRVTKNGSASRPLLNGGEEDDDQSEEEKAFARLSSIWTVRKGFYETADVTVSIPGTDDGEGMSTLRLVEEVLCQVEKLLKERGVKKPVESSDWMTEL